MTTTLPHIPALTVQRPWAFCITSLNNLVAKRVENRCWRTSYRGDMLLHAGRGWDAPGVQAARRSLHRSGGVLDAIPSDPSQHPSGFVAVVRLAGICSQPADSARVVCGCGPWAAAGQHHWQIEHVRLLAQPVGWSGAQKLWWPPQEALELVAAQLPETVPA